jgi:hypothetical protein
VSFPITRVYTFVNCGRMGMHSPSIEVPVINSVIQIGMEAARIVTSALFYYDSLR